MPKAKTTKKSEPAAEKPAEEVELVKYEIMAIIDPDVNEAQYKKHFEDFKKIFTKQGATIIHEDEWGKRELAYTIKKQDLGFYVVLNFELDPSKLDEINAQLRITPYLLRSLIIKTPEGYTPQKYDWDAEEETKKTEDPKPKEEKKVAPPPVKEEAPEEVKEEPEPEVEVEKEVAEEPPVEEKVEEKAEEPEVEEAPEEEAEEEEPEAEEEPEEEVEEKVEEVVEEKAEEEEPETEEEPEEEVEEEPEPEVEEKAEEPAPKEEVDKDLITDSSDRLSKLDAKLEELLSDDDDLNL